MHRDLSQDTSPPKLLQVQGEPMKVLRHHGLPWDPLAPKITLLEHNCPLPTEDPPCWPAETFCPRWRESDASCPPMGTSYVPGVR